MRLRWPGVWIRFALLIFTLGGAAASAQSPGASLQHWRKMQSDHFAVYSNAEPARVQDVLHELETQHESYGVLGKTLDENGPPIRVLFFADAASYLPFQVASGAPAFFQSGRGQELIVAHDAGSDATEVLRHEFFHAATARVGLQFPRWLDEGLADAYATFSKDGRCREFGAPIPRHLQSLERQKDGGFRAQRIFKMTSSDVDGLSQGDRQLFYAKSWLIVSFLSQQKPWSESFDAYLKAAQTEDSAGAIWEIYHKTPDDMDTALKDFRPEAGRVARTCTDPVAFTRANGTDSKALGKEMPLQPWEVPLLQADVLVFLGRHEAAASAYAQLAKDFPEVAAVRDSQGLLAMERLDLPAAQRYFEEAVQRGTSNGEVYYRLATLHCGMASKDARCLEWIDRALTLNTTSRETLLYAIDFALNVQDYRRALRYIDSARPLNNGDEFQFLLKTAYAQYHLESFDAARETLRQAERTLPGGDRRKEIADLQRAIDQREAYVVQSRLFNSTEGTGGAAQAEALRKALAAFTQQENAMLENGILREIVCEGDRVTLLADTPSGRLRLEVENAMDLMVLRGTQRMRELELVCGPRKNETAQFGYLRQGSGTETRGLLRILRFDPGRNAGD